MSTKEIEDLYGMLNIETSNENSDDAIFPNLQYDMPTVLEGAEITSTNTSSC